MMTASRTWPWNIFCLTVTDEAQAGGGFNGRLRAADREPATAERWRDNAFAQRAEVLARVPIKFIQAHPASGRLLFN